MLAWGKTVDVPKDSIARTTSGNGEYYQNIINCGSDLTTTNVCL